MWSYVSFLHGGPDPRCCWSNVHSPALAALLKIVQLSGALVEVMQFAVQLLGVILAGSVVLYLVKVLDSGGAYATHSETYTWFWTLAYMRGEVPAGLLLVLWTGAVSACFYRVVVRPLSGRAEPADKEVADVEVDSISRGRVLPIAAAIFLNACVTGTVNALYIWSVQQSLGRSLHFGLQLILSIFRLLYAAVALPALTRSVHSAAANVRLRFSFLMVNNLLLPCLVTALTSDACFQVRQCP